VIIYCVIGYYAYESWLAEVFSTKELAEKFIEIRKGKSKYEYEVEEKELDFYIDD
jgi:hypothetical protein